MVNMISQACVPRQQVDGYKLTGPGKTNSDINTAIQRDPGRACREPGDGNGQVTNSNRQPGSNPVQKYWQCFA